MTGTAAETRGYHLRSDGKQVTHDVISDFTHTLDKIDLSAIDAKTVTAADDAFTFIGESAFSNQAGQLRAVTVFGVSTTLYGDIDGDGVADLQIVLNPSVLALGDFVL